MEKLRENFTSLEKKIHSIRCEMQNITGEFNEIRLKIQIEVKIGEEKEKRTTFEKENFTISEEQNSHNWNSNDRRICRILM